MMSFTPNQEKLATVEFMETMETWITGRSPHWDLAG